MVFKYYNYGQIGENEYFSTKGAEEFDVNQSNEDQIKYANYTPDLPIYNGKDIVFFTGHSDRDNSGEIKLYKKVNNKLVYTGEKVNAAKGFSMQYWKAFHKNIKSLILFLGFEWILNYSSTSFYLSATLG